MTAQSQDFMMQSAGKIKGEQSTAVFVFSFFPSPASAPEWQGSYAGSEICGSRDGQWLRCAGKGEREIGNADMKRGASLSAAVKRSVCVPGRKNPCGKNARLHWVSKHFGFLSYIYVICTIIWPQKQQLFKHRVGFSNLPKINFTRADDPTEVSWWKLCVHFLFLLATLPFLHSSDTHLLQTFYCLSPQGVSLNHFLSFCVFWAVEIYGRLQISHSASLWKTWSHVREFNWNFFWS